MRASICVMALTLSTATFASQDIARHNVSASPAALLNTEHKVTDPDGATGSFGRPGIAITSTGLALIPAYFDPNGAQAGRVYFYLKAADGSWGFKQELADSANHVGEEFGYSLAVQGTVAVVGAPGANGAAGRACVFNFASGLWTQVATLAPSDLGAQDQFGYSVAMTSSTILVGAPSFQNPWGGGSGGAVYAFQKNGSGVWTQVQKFTSSNDTATDGFGASLAMSGTTAIVSSPRLATPTNGSLYVFENMSGSWTQKQELHPSGVGTFKSYNVTISMSGNTAIVGAPDSTINLTAGEGMAYVFTSASGTWSQTQQLYLASSHGDAFGSSVDMADNGDVLIGAWHAPVGSNANQGSAYRYVENASGVYVASGGFAASDGQANDGYGSGVAFDKGPALGGPTDIAIGAYGVRDPSGNNTGAVYFYPYP